VNRRLINSARPGQGVTSTFRFGCAYGGLKMALAACGVPFTIVTPQRWKKALGVLTGADKEASRQRALQLFPDQAANLVRKGDHARADAMLLAYFGMQVSAPLGTQENRHGSGAQNVRTVA
jgi:crossover junction endodeoxyribonuclease RuvC